MKMTASQLDRLLRVISALADEVENMELDRVNDEVLRHLNMADSHLYLAIQEYENNEGH